MNRFDDELWPSGKISAPRRTARFVFIVLAGGAVGAVATVAVMSELLRPDRSAAAIPAAVEDSVPAAAVEARFATVKAVAQGDLATTLKPASPEPKLAAAKPAVETVGIAPAAPAVPEPAAIPVKDADLTFAKGYAHRRAAAAAETAEKAGVAPSAATTAAPPKKPVKAAQKKYRKPPPPQGEMAELAYGRRVTMQSPFAYQQQRQRQDWNVSGLFGRW